MNVSVRLSEPFFKKSRSGDIFAVQRVETGDLRGTLIGRSLIDTRIEYSWYDDGSVWGVPGALDDKDLVGDATAEEVAGMRQSAA